MYLPATGYKVVPPPCLDMQPNLAHSQQYLDGQLVQTLNR
jgi:hypothetical protein